MARYRSWKRALSEGAARLAFVWLSFAPLALGQNPQPVPENPVPEYPEKARYALITGDVWFRAQVNERGLVDSVEITRVPQEEMGFEDAVTPVIRKWRFEPARNALGPVAAVFEGNVRFSLRPEDEEAIRAMVDRSAMAWNRRDAGVLAGQFADSAHIHTITQAVASGPYQIRQRFEELLTGPFRATKLILGVDMIRFFEGNRAEVDQTYQLEGNLESIGRLSILMTKEDDEWLIEHGHLVGPAARFWDTDPVLERKPPDPAYPPAAAEHGVRGKVVLDILVGLDGATEVVEVLEGLPHGCSEMAIENARLWRWKPARRGENPVEASGEIWIRCGPSSP